MMVSIGSMASGGSFHDDPELVLRHVGVPHETARLDTLFLTLPVSWRGTISHRLSDPTWDDTDILTNIRIFHWLEDCL
jgi:hypothetical protein